MDFSLLATCQYPQQSDFSSGHYHNRLLHTFTAPNLAKLAANVRQLLAFSPENMVVGWDVMCLQLFHKLVDTGPVDANIFLISSISIDFSSFLYLMHFVL